MLDEHGSVINTLVTSDESLYRGQDMETGHRNSSFFKARSLNPRHECHGTFPHSLNTKSWCVSVY